MKKLFVIASIIGINAFAETAILCGNLEKIQTDDKVARIHMVIDNEIIRSKEDVKFFNVFGKNREIVHATNMNGQDVVTLSKERYIFQTRSFGVCDGEQTFKVDIVASKKRQSLDCVCFQD